MSLNPFEGSGSPAAKFPSKGDKVAGKIKSVEYKADTDFKTGKVKTFEDGSPRPVVVVTLDVNGEEVRDFVKGRSVTQFRQKVWDVEGPGEAPKVGADYSRTFVDERPTAGGNPEKLYEISYSAATDRGSLV